MGDEYACVPGLQNGTKSSAEAIENIFDGNIRRCTGYRPILYAMQHFAADFVPHVGAMTCKIYPADCPPKLKQLLFTPGLPQDWVNPKSLQMSNDNHLWSRPLSLGRAIELIDEHKSFDNLKLVVGNTANGVYNLFLVNLACELIT